MEYYLAIRKTDPAICKNMNEAQRDYTKCSKLDIERQVLTRGTLKKKKKVKLIERTEKEMATHSSVFA